MGFAREFARELPAGSFFYSSAGRRGPLTHDGVYLIPPPLSKFDDQFDDQFGSVRIRFDPSNGVLIHQLSNIKFDI